MAVGCVLWLNRTGENMSNLRGRALENEYRDIVSELDGDAEGRAQGDSYLIASGDAGVTWAVTPKVFGSAELEVLSDAAETMGRIMEKVTARYLVDPDFRKLFGLSPEVEALTLVPTGYDQLIPFARLDTLFDEETGDYQFCGITTDGSTGMTASVDVTRAIQLTESYRRFSSRHHAIETYDLADAAVAALRETYQSWVNAAEGSRHPEHPTVGIVDYPESANPEEFGDLIERMADEGIYARFVDIRELRIEEAGGTRRLVDPEGPIACVYRRAVTSEMAEKPCPGADALVEAQRSGIACVVGGYRAWPVATTAFVAALHSKAVESVLDPHEVAFVRAHVPEAHLLGPETDLSAFADKDRWVVRPAGAYNPHITVLGIDCDEREWAERLSEAARRGGVVQAFRPAYASEVVVGDEETGAEPVLVNNVTGLYLFRGRFGGLFSRCGVPDGADTWGRVFDMGSIVVRE